MPKIEPTTPFGEDLLLARRAARADTVAWDELIELYGGRIYSLALRFASTPAEAEDLTQEIFLKLYRYLDRYRGDVPLMAWALRLSRNLCIDHYRHCRARRQSETVPIETLELAAAGDDPRAKAQAREQLELVEGALSEMPEALSTVLVLRDLQGLSYQEIAAFLEVSIGTLKSRLHRARRVLLQRMEERLDLEPEAGDVGPRLEGVPC